MAEGFEERFAAGYAGIPALARARLSRERAPISTGTLARDDALSRSGAVDERLMRVAEMRVILGMDVAEIAAALEISAPTVKRDWQRAKAYLHEALGVQPP